MRRRAKTMKCPKKAEYHPQAASSGRRRVKTMKCHKGDATQADRNP